MTEELKQGAALPPTRPQDLLKRCKDVIGIINCDECGHWLALHLDRYGCDYETGDAPCGCKAENLSDDGNDAFVLLKELRAAVADPVRRDRVREPQPTTMKQVGPLVITEVSCPECSNVFPVRGELAAGARVPEPQPDPWQHVPKQYKTGRWAFDYDDKNNVFFVHCDGHRVCDAEDSEVASAICQAYNNKIVAGAGVPEDGPQPQIVGDGSNLPMDIKAAQRALAAAPVSTPLVEENKCFMCGRDEHDGMCMDQPDFCVCDYRPRRKCSVHPGAVSTPDWHAFYTESQTALYHEQEVNEELRNKLRAVSAPQPDPQLEQARFEAEFGPVPKGRVSAHTMLRWNHNREGWMARAGGSETSGAAQKGEK